MRTSIRLLLAMLLLSEAALGASPVAAQQAPSGDSAITVSGTGDFANLKVTVNKTKDLINQIVSVSWTGGAPTPPEGPTRNFLQIMQCWGDDPAGPDRTQCEFGALRNGAPPGGANVRIRRVPPLILGESLPPGPDGGSYVPFWPAGGKQPATLTSEETGEFFDAQVTNEVPIAFTRSNGTGQVNFEVQTVRESAGLKCGEPVEANGTTTGRTCWLVIVPRGTKEIDGTTPQSGGLSSSPLAQRNWDNKIAIPLQFLPQGRPCPLGAPNRPVVGHEMAVEAVSRWQPALCANGGTLFSFTQVSDDLARSQLLEANDAGLALMSNPSAQPRPDRQLVYAPIAVSGLVVAFNIVANPPDGLSPDDPRQALAGQPFTDMKLTPRLIAKLLTQSYKGAIAGFGKEVPAGQDVVPPRPARLQSNPWGLTSDPEFLELNPGFQAEPKPGFQDRALLRPELHVDALIQLGTSDLTGLLWDWVLADSDARAFIDGTKDPWGMVVNDVNKGLRPPLDSYPRNDQSCIPITIPGTSTIAPFCTGDEHAFADDMHVAGRAASRGDTLGRDLNAPSNNPVVGVDGKKIYTFAKKPRQPITEQALISVVDVATADRYQLPTARLRNAARQFVAPDAAGLRAGLDAMKPGPVAGTFQADPTTNNAAAYPLTSLSQAGTSPPSLTKEEGREYAAFIRYAVGAGQQLGPGPGQLPLGYLPLPEPLRQQALAAATIIESQAGKSNDQPGDVPNSPDLAGPSGNGAGPIGGGTNSGSGTGSGPGATSTAPNGATPPNLAPAGVAPTAPGGATNPPAIGPVRRTLALAAPVVGAVLIALLVAGGLAAALALVTHRLGAPTNDTEGGDATSRTGIRRFLSWRTVRPVLFARRR